MAKKNAKKTSAPQGKSHTQKRPTRPGQAACEAYCRALCDTIKYGAGATVPVMGPPTYSYTARTRGFLTTGTGGWGFVMANPGRAVAGDLQCLFSTNSTFNGGAFADSGTGVFGVNSSSAYDSAADFGLARDKGEFRVVAATLRTMYTGTALNCNGVIRATTLPNRYGLTDMTTTEFNNIAQCTTEPVRLGKMVDVNWAPSDISSMTSWHNNPDTGVTYNYNMGALIFADPGTNFFFEFVVTFELVGPLVSMLVEPHAEEDSTAQRVAGWFADQVGWAVRNPQEAMARMAHGIRVARGAAAVAGVIAAANGQPPPWRLEL